MPNLIRWPLLLGLVLIAGVVLGVFYLKSSEQSGPFWEKYQKVRLGMKEKEVKGNLGPPNSEEGSTFGDSTLAWFEAEQTIAVDFDLDGKAIEKRFKGRFLGWVRERAKWAPSPTP